MDIDASYTDMLNRRARALATLCVHGQGESGDELEPPLVLSSAFRFADAEDAAARFRGDAEGYIYGRWANPTVRALETQLARLEGAEAACAAASGMAAITGAILSLCKSGDHVVAPQSMYGESARLLRERLPPLGIETSFVRAPSAQAYEAAIRPNTRLLFVETPSNPTLDVTDIRAVAALARARGLVTMCDNTFATPFAQTPLALGADVVVHSMTKAISGHGDVIAGVVCGKAEMIARARDYVTKSLGGVLSPWAAYLVMRGIKTFAIRLREASETAAWLSTQLANHPQVARVLHPSLASHEGHALAKAQMHAFGTVLSFEPKGDGSSRARQVLNRVRVVAHAVSLGDARSLIVHPASTTHASMPAEGRTQAGITEGLLRLSVGLEAKEDLWADLVQAIA